MRQLWIHTLPTTCVVLACGVTAGCGGVSRNDAEPAAGTGGAAAGTSGIAGGLSIGGACPVPPGAAPPVIDGGPPASGCAVDTGGAWQQVPCDGELWLRNALPSALNVNLALAFTPADIVPSLTGSPDVEIHFKDADASWFGVWAQQAGNGTSFTVVNAGGTTSVRLGVSDLSLGAVPLAGCESRTTTGSVVAPFGTALYFEMKATFTESSGTLVAVSRGEYYQPASHSVFSDGGDGGDGGSGPPQ